MVSVHSSTPASEALAIAAHLALISGLAVTLSGCDIQLREGGDIKVGMFSAQAEQNWARTYALAAGGQIEIANSNGPVEISQGAAGSSVEVRADITAKALTDAGGAL